MRSIQSLAIIVADLIGLNSYVWAPACALFDFMTEGRQSERGASVFDITVEIALVE